MTRECLAVVRRVEFAVQGALICLLLCGCVFAPAKFGGRGIVEPGCDQYERYLANCRNLSPILDEKCRSLGNPAAIQIGHSGGYFVWAEPQLLVSVGAFGNTSQTTRIPRGLRKYAGVPEVRKPVPASAPSVSSAAGAAGSQAMSGAYSVERFERVTGDEFAYVFRIVFAETNGIGLAAAQRVKRELRSSVEEDYRAARPDARGESVQIDFPEFSMKGSVVEGRAEITRIAVTSLTYDDVTQKGVISVRIGASSFEKARAWVRKNIETIVRDKNIALTTGKVPADKRFFLGAERVLEGNILQVEFETE